MYMRTSLSFNLTRDESKKTQALVKKRGFRTTSDYLRFLISQDDVDLISEHELIKRALEIERMHQTGKLVKARSLKELMK